MKYEAYEDIARDVTADTALETVTALLELARTDSVETDAKIAELNQQVEDGKAKYNDLQVDYIKKFTSSSAEDEVKDEEEADEEVEKAIEEMLS